MKYCYKVYCNTKQLLDAATKVIYIIHLKAFLCKLDNVLLLKCMYILLSHKILFTGYTLQRSTHTRVRRVFRYTAKRMVTTSVRPN
jgi:hypothetical protein